MSDTLVVFGKTFNNVAGFKATDDNDATKTYVRPQGTKSITANGTGIDVSAYATADVAVPSSSPSLQAKTNISPTTSSQTITPDTGYDGLSSVQINAMPTGTAGTPSASKGTVSNHAITVTPSVTNTTGYITGGTKSGTAVTVSASELVSGNLEITQNGTGIDVANYSTVSVAVEGGGSGSVVEAQIDTELQSNSATLTFSGLEGEPTSFVVMYDDDVSVPSGAPYKIVSVVYDGATVHAQTLTNTANAQVTYNGSNLSKSYSNGTLTITSTGAQFPAGWWVMSYTHGGTSANIHTSDVQVGSGATTIAFPNLGGEPLCWSLIFKSNFSTSSGYQRVIAVRKRVDVNDGTNIYGFAMDSQAHGMSTYWTESYSNGTLTITSNGTNQGGYFHQPGYYQLTYAIGEASPYETVSKTYRALTSAQSDTIEPSSGYDAIAAVNVSIPAVTQTNLSAANIKSGTTITIGNGQSNLWSVTGTYSGGGSSKNVQVAQSTTRVANTAYTKTASLTCSVTGTYDVYWDCFRSSTSGTNGSQLYIGGNAYGTANTTFSSNIHAQNNHLTGVQINANQEVAVYVRSRATNYYAYCGQLTIVQTA